MVSCILHILAYMLSSSNVLFIASTLLCVSTILCWLYPVFFCAQRHESHVSFFWYPKDGWSIIHITNICGPSVWNLDPTPASGRLGVTWKHTHFPLKKNDLPGILKPTVLPENIVSLSHPFSPWSRQKHLQKNKSKTLFPLSLVRFCEIPCRCPLFFHSSSWIPAILYVSPCTSLPMLWLNQAQYCSITIVLLEFRTYLLCRFKISEKYRLSTKDCVR